MGCQPMKHDPMLAALIRQKAISDPEFRRKVEREIAWRRGPKEFSMFKKRVVVQSIGAPPKITIQRIVDAASAASGLNSEEIISPRRGRHCTYWRHIVMDIARRRTSLSFPEIGAQMDGRHHSTIISGVQKVEANPALYAADIKRVEALL